MIIGRIEVLPRRTWAAALATIALAFATITTQAHVSPARAKTTRSVVIDRSTVFTASETSSIRLRFAEGLSWSDVQHVHIKGQGRMFGFILLKRGDFAQEAERPWFKSMITAACDTRACKTPRREHPGAIGF